jgi:hypothetical protein
MEKGESRAMGNDSAHRAVGEHSERTHLPPAITIDFVLLDDLYALARTKINFVFVLWEEVVPGINVFHHGKGGL